MQNLTSELQIQADRLINLIKVTLEEIEKNNEWSRQLTNYDRDLKTAKDQLFTREKEFAKRELELEAQKNLMKQAQLELRIREKTLDTKVEQFNKKIEKERELDEKRQEEIKELDKKILESSDIDGKLLKLEEATQVMEREKRIDRERKEALDIQTNKNIQEAERLQKLASRFS